MHLQVGKIYGHSSGNTKFKIIRQWNSTIFEGFCVEEREKRWLFSSFGKTLGYPNHTGHVLSWGLKELDPEYEVKGIFSDGIVNSEWRNLSAVYVTSTYETMYLVREKNNHKSTKLMNAEELTILKNSLELY